MSFAPKEIVVPFNILLTLFECFSDMAYGYFEKGHV
jgi:hypothetical protein